MSRLALLFPFCPYGTCWGSFQRHGALSRLGLILPAPLPLRGGLCPGFPSWGSSLNRSLDYPLNTDVPVLGVTGVLGLPALPFLILPCTSYSGMTPVAPPPFFITVGL